MPYIYDHRRNIGILVSGWNALIISKTYKYVVIALIIVYL